MAASSSSAAADPRPPKHDVFISFRGETRKGFTSHLYKALSGKQIDAYIDEVSLEKGDTISRALPEAIKESEISIIIFSKKYAESRWCLDELVHILKRWEEKDQIVLPIFYKIDPSHIRHQKETYAAAFEKHEEHYKSKKVQAWRQALAKAADITGWDSRNMHESKIIEEVVERVERELDTIMSKRSDVWKGLVGIPKRLEKIKSYLDSPAVRVGIWGMGGIGKTTLAKAAFNRFYNDFEGSYFAHGVRDNAINNGLATLKKEVYSELLGSKNLDTSKTSAVNHRLSRKRILLVLDDVENPTQFEDLVGDPYRFCPGSKIIVTSRHKLRVDAEYNVEVLLSFDACKLFYLTAFGHESCKRGFKEISDRVVEYTKGHPLALKVLGASVFCFLESIEDWGKELKKLKRIPNDEIQVVLKRSYNALDAEEKGLFLDIACFLKGKRRDFVEGILEGKPITGLVNKSLITIEDGRIRMHDLIREMGRDIVCQSTDNLGERSRLWIAQDVSFVLENNKGTEAIEGIHLPWIEEDEELHLRPDVFEEMCKLRLLKIYDALRLFRKVKVYIDGDLKYLPNWLRYLHWECYPGKSLPSNFKPQNLVELQMPNSKLEQLWGGVQKFGSLKHINLYNSKLLTKIADLSLAPKLESINLSGCNNLKTLPKLSGSLRELWLGDTGIEQIPASSIKCLSSLQRLSLDRCKSLERLPSNIWKLKALEEIDLSCCPKLRNLPEIENQSERLWKLNLQDTSIQNLPSSIENLIQLRDLNLSECEHLEFIPKSLCKLTRLERFSLRFSLDFMVPRCSKLKKFTMFSGLCSLTELDLSNCNIRDIPDWLGSLTSLVSLDLNRNFFERIPSSIRKLHKLTWLDISVCHNLQSLPVLPLFIEYVNADNCSSLEMVSTTKFSLARWLHKYDSLRNSRQRFRQFSFVKCSKLDENAITNIFTEFQSKVFCIAATSQEEVVKSKGIIPGVVVAYPRHKIPKWFDYQSEGSSITIKLPPNWYDPKKFLGFVVSVIEKKSSIMQHYYSAQCKLYSKSKSLKVDLSLYMEKGMFSVRSDFILRSDHVLMWYECFDHSTANFEEYREASFVFTGCKVKRCGVRMLYLQDAVKY